MKDSIQMERFERIIRIIQQDKLVMIMGAPGTGKTRILNQIAEYFEKGQVNSSEQRQHFPGSAVSIPAIPTDDSIGSLPMIRRQNRKVFRVTLHQNSKYRDFVSGIMPKLDGTNGFFVTGGILYQANEFAKKPDSAALLIIDEINRGPVVEVFGPSIGAIEADKRLDDNNEPLPTTQGFTILNPKMKPDYSGNESAYTEYQLSPHLYILAAMNQADVSVAPIDIAFLRRWRIERLYPDYDALLTYFHITPKENLPQEDDGSVETLYDLAYKALQKINEKIVAGRGEAYQIGHGVYMSKSPVPTRYKSVCEYLLKSWSSIYSHIEEVFFGDITSIAYIINANCEYSPYVVKEVSFADSIKYVLSSPEIESDAVFNLFRSLCIK